MNYKNNLSLVSIIIPCYNAEKYVESAVRSIMNQTYKNLEIILTDDCSTDGTFSILEKLATEDSRIKLYKNETNLKIVRTLNKMVQFANGKYIARMDADDISLLNRIEKQVEFLEKNLDIAFCGTNAFIINEKTQMIGKSHLPLSNEDISIYIKYGNPFLHPSIMINSEICKRNLYDEKYIYAEDYELWQRLIKLYKVRNLKENLIKYRILKNSISNNSKSNSRQRELFLELSSSLDMNIFKLKDKKVIANLLISRSRIENSSFYVPVQYKFIYYTERFFYKIKNAFIKF